MTWNSSDLIGVISAGITFIALVVAFIIGIRSIQETRNIQRRAFRQGLLNDLAQWAEKVIDWRLDNRMALTKASDMLEVRQNQRFMYLHLGEIQDYFSSITGRNAYVIEVSRIFQQGLPEDIHRLINDLDAYTHFLQSYQQMVKTDFGKDPVNIDTDSIDEKARKADAIAQQAAKTAVCVLEKVLAIQAKEMN